MKLAEKFGRPILTFLDTPGAYPGMDAEERGQAEAIARNLYEMARIANAYRRHLHRRRGAAAAPWPWASATAC